MQRNQISKLNDDVWKARIFGDLEIMNTEADEKSDNDYIFRLGKVRLGGKRVFESTVDDLEKIELDTSLSRLGSIKKRSVRAVKGIAELGKVWKDKRFAPVVRSRIAELERSVNSALALEDDDRRKKYPSMLLIEARSLLYQVDPTVLQAELMILLENGDELCFLAALGAPAIRPLITETVQEELKEVWARNFIPKVWEELEFLRDAFERTKAFFEAIERHLRGYLHPSDRDEEAPEQAA